MKNFLYGILLCLMLFCAHPAHAQTLVSGSTATGTVPASPPCSTNCYDTQTFSGTAGQGVFGTIVSSISSCMNWSVYKPDGTFWTSSCGYFNLTNLPQTGTYTVRISSPVTGVGGGYTVYFVAGGGGTSGGALTSGTTITDSLPTGGLTSYTFSGTAGQGMQLRFAAPSLAWNTTIYVYKPDGSYWSDNTDTFIATLPSTGTYTVVLQDSTSGSAGGSYSLAYVIGGGAVSGGSIASGGSISDTLSAGLMTSYTFSGTTNNGITLSVGDMSWATNVYIYTPDGDLWKTVTTNNFSTISTDPLPQTGTYTVVFAAQTYGNNGSFHMYYVQGGDTVSWGTNPFPSGGLDGGPMASNQLVSYKFAGTSGQAISIHVGASFSTQINLYTPDGHYLGYSTSGVYNITSLTQSGNYTAVVFPSPYSSSAPGNYNFFYVKGDDSVSDGSLISGKQRGGLMPLNGIRSFTFQAEASHSISITTSCPFSATYGCYSLLFKPDGSYWGYIGNSYSGTTPAVAGAYTLVLYEETGTKTGNYTITLTTTQPTPGSSNNSQSAPPPPPPYNFTPSVGNMQNISVNQSTNAAGQAAGAPQGAPGATCCLGAAATGNTTASSNSDNGGPQTKGGNPIDFDLGYKLQTAVDYQAGGLNFTRIYRSDSTWTNNTIGTLWRHNFARSLTVVPTTSASITDGTGTTTSYTWAGTYWAPTIPGTQQGLANFGTGYIYVLPNGTKEKYNSSLQLYRIEYVGGGALNLTYNGSGQLTGVANENGRSLSLTYDGSGRVATLVTPDGTFSYSYDSNSNLTKVTKPDTNTIQYEYENATYIHALTGITDENGVRFATFGYDSSGRATSTQHAGGVDEYTVAYNSDGTSTVTNPLGKTFTYYYKNIQGLRHVIEIDGAASTNTPASSEYFGYDQYGNMVSMTDWAGNVTLYSYYGNGVPQSIVEGAYTAQEHFTKVKPNDSFNVPSSIWQYGGTEPNSKNTAYAYDAYGRLTSVTVTPGNSLTPSRVTSYSYYPNSTDGSGNLIVGRLETITGPRTDVSETTTYAYDSNFNLSTITNALSQVTTITAIDASGRPTKITDPNSVETDIAYDTNGRVTSMIAAKGTALQATTGFTYDADGQLTKLTLPNSVTVQYSYDNAQRLTGIQDALGNTVAYTLDNAGNRTQTQFNNTTPSQTYIHTRTFDELSRLLHSVGASSQTAKYAYDTDSNLTSFTDPNTNVTSYTYDPLNRLATTTDALSGVVTPGYDALNNVASVKDQRGNSTTYTYDSFGDVIGETSPDRGTLSYTVDNAGNITQRTDARSVVTNYTYDALNRLTGVSYPSDSTLNVSLTYDSSSGCGTPYIGHLCSATDAAGTTAYQYDVLGRVTQEKDTRSSLNLTTSYSYDLAGNLTGLTLPSGRTVSYTLDGNGNVSGASAVVNGTSTTLASSITYLPFGPLNALTYGNSLTFSGTFDDDYNPTNRTVSGSIYNWTYTTDSNGNIKEAGSTTYGYDALNRINAENPGTSVSYTYDATSNRLTKGSTTTTVPSTSNKISAVGSNSYTYDASGNITADGVNTYTWNAEGELKEVDVGGSPVGDYTYNLYRQRAEKVAASTTYYVYGAGGLLYGEYDTSGNFIREYVYLNGAPLAQIDAGSPEVLTYLHTDHLGTPRFGTNASGTQVWSWNNDGFGTSVPSGAATVNLRMPGQYYDSESGLFYNWNRVYNPAIGRYISSDPVGLKGGLNTFNYVSVNPVNDNDSLGLYACITTKDGFTECTSSVFVFVHYIGNQPPGSITDISIYGHAAWNNQHIDESDDSQNLIQLGPNNQAYVTSDNGGVIPLSKLLNGKLASGATIGLNGCNANSLSDAQAQGANTTITQAVSSAAGPGVYVTGSSMGTRRTGQDQAVPFPYSQTTYENGQPVYWPYAFYPIH